MNSQVTDREERPSSVGEGTVRSLVRAVVLTCTPETPIAEAAAMMAQNKCGSIVVAKDGLPLGIWTEKDALSLDFARPEIFDEPISKFMAAPLISINGNATTQNAAGKLREHGIRHLIVVDDAGAMVGVVSQTDVVMRLGIDSYLSFRKVNSVGFREVVSLAHDMTVGEAIHRIHARGSDAALVTENGVPVGIVTERDIVRLVARRKDNGTIGEVATRSLITVSTGATLIEARNTLEARKFRHLVVAGEDGGILGILSMADILAATEQGYVRHLEEILDERDRRLVVAESRLELILHAAGEGVVGLDSTGCVIFVNSTAIELLGFPQSAVLGRNWRELTCFVPYQTPCCCAETCTTVATLGSGGAHFLNCSFKKSDGSLFPVEIAATPLVEKGQHAGAVLVFRDITEQKRAETALYESEQRMRLLLDAVGEGIYGLDTDGRVVLVNQTAAQLLGWAPEELVGRKLHEMIHHTRPDGSPYPAVECPVHATFVSGERHEVKGELFWRRDGSSFPVEYVVTPVLKDNILAGAVSVFRDVTERLKSEEILRRERNFTRWVIDSLPGIFCVITSEGRFDLWNRNLESVSGYDADEISRMDVSTLFEHGEKDFIAEGVMDVEIVLVTKDKARIPYYFSGRRTPPAEGSRLVGMGIDISQRRVMEERLSQSNRDLESFAYVASHDLQEPLRVVTGFVQLLSREYRGKLGADADEYIGFAVDGAHRMQSLIRDLLEFSRVGTQGKPFEEVDIDQAVDEALLNLQPRIEESQAVVTHDPLPTIMADRAQIVRLFQNLVGNAIKYGKPGVPPIIRVGARFAGGGWVFFVRDNGIGIAPQYFDRIFMIFQRLHGRDEYEGTGIGLAVCKKIVERHGGKIWLTSEPGNGATFFFTLGNRG